MCCSHGTANYHVFWKVWTLVPLQQKIMALKSSHHHLIASVLRQTWLTACSGCLRHSPSLTFWHFHRLLGRKPCLRLCSWHMPTFSKAYTQVTELSLSDRLETTFAASNFQPNKSYRGECCVGGREDGDRRLSTQNGVREMPPSAHGMKGLHRHVVT